MREIKFRGKQLDNSEWVYGWFLGYSEATGYIYGDYVDKNEVWQVDPATVGQFTGLTDKHGKDIYEGDALRIECDSCLEAHIVKVERDGCTLTVDVCGEDYDCTAITWAMDKWDNESSGAEIIGNIHDNPELLNAD